MLFDFTTNFDLNRVMFDSVDSSLIIFLNLSNLLISHLNSSSDLIKFEEIPKKYCGFDPYSPLYHFIHDYNIKLVSLELVFDTYLHVFNDHVDSSH